MTDSINSYAQNDLSVARFQNESSSIKALQDSLTTNNKPENKKLKEASQQFESVFVHQLLQVMDKTIERSDFMHGGQGEDMFRDLFYQEIAKNISSNPSYSFGLGKQVYEQLSRYE